MKTATSFSEKKKDVLRHAIALGQNKGVACRKCVGLQNVEMECVMCEQIKGLDGFTKAQRRNPDTAVSTDQPAGIYIRRADSFH